MESDICCFSEHLPEFKICLAYGFKAFYPIYAKCINIFWFLEQIDRYIIYMYVSCIFFISIIIGDTGADDLKNNKP